MYSNSTKVQIRKNDNQGGAFRGDLIKVNKNQSNNPCLKELVPGSFKLVESCANTAGGNNFGNDSIYEDFQIDKISVLFVSLKYHIER